MIPLFLNRLISWFKKTLNVFYKVNGKKRVDTLVSPVKEKSIEVPSAKSEIKEALPVKPKTKEMQPPEEEIHEIITMPWKEPLEILSVKEPPAKSKEEIRVTESGKNSETHELSKESKGKQQEEVLKETGITDTIKQPDKQTNEIPKKMVKHGNRRSFEQEPSVITLRKELKESSEEIITDKNPQIEYSPDEVISKEKETKQKPKKPYKKKSPIEERKTFIQLSNEKKPSIPEKKKIINLGTIRKNRRKVSEARVKTSNDGSKGKKITDKELEKEEFTTDIEAPYVEIVIDKKEVNLVLPKQQFVPCNKGELSRELSYTIHLNGEQLIVPVKVVIVKDGHVIVEEKRLLLEKPLLEFQVTYPDEIKGGEYSYRHVDYWIYFYVAKGNNCGSFCYLNDETGKINPMPKNVIWVLLHEDFELQMELGPGDIDEAIWIWETYKPFRIDLTESNSLNIKNIKLDEEKSYLLESTFSLNGEKSVNDDFYKECPLITGKTVEIIAPYENELGWNVWIQNKIAGYNLIKEIWTGEEPLSLCLPEDLPCEFGEFQVDICQQKTRIPDDTIFFRVLPSISLEYTKELIIPDKKSATIPSTIVIWLYSNDNWNFQYKGNQEIESKQKQPNNFEIELPPEEEIFRFALTQKNRPETIVNFQISIPRLKWKTSNHLTWNTQPEEIDRDLLVSGSPIYLQMRTNDFINKYYFQAILEDNDLKLQEGGFKRKGQEYYLELNQFYDTIKQNKGSLTIRVEISKTKTDQILGSVKTLCFTSEQNKLQEIKPEEPIENISSGLTKIHVKAGHQYQLLRKIKSKGFSKNELLYAGITLKDVYHLKIHYDKRRKSSHQMNIEELKFIKNKFDNIGR